VKIESVVVGCFDFLKSFLDSLILLIINETSKIGSEVFSRGFTQIFILVKNFFLAGVFHIKNFDHIGDFVFLEYLRI